FSSSLHVALPICNSHGLVCHSRWTDADDRSPVHHIGRRVGVCIANRSSRYRDCADVHRLFTTRELVHSSGAPCRTILPLRTGCTIVPAAVMCHPRVLTPHPESRGCRKAESPVRLASQPPPVHTVFSRENRFSVRGTDAHEAHPQ